MNELIEETRGARRKRKIMENCISCIPHNPTTMTNSMNQHLFCSVPYIKWWHSFFHQSLNHIRDIIFYELLFKKPLPAQVFIKKAPSELARSWGWVHLGQKIQVPCHASHGWTAAVEWISLSHGRKCVIEDGHELLSSSRYNMI